MQVDIRCAIFPTNINITRQNNNNKGKLPCFREARTAKERQLQYLPGDEIHQQQKAQIKY